MSKTDVIVKREYTKKWGEFEDDDEEIKLLRKVAEIVTKEIFADLETKTKCKYDDEKLFNFMIFGGVAWEKEKKKWLGDLNDL